MPLVIAFTALNAQQQPSSAGGPAPASPAAAVVQSSTQTDAFIVAVGTHIPLSMINSVRAKTATEGDRIYLLTVFPILVNSRVVIPPGSYVSGTVTQVKRPGRANHPGELHVRFDALTLPNGVTRDFRGRPSDGRTPETLDKSEGKIAGESDKAGEVRTIGAATGTGATVGGLAGAASGSAGMGAGIGAAAGLAAGIVSVLLTRGPDAVLARGTTVEMVLDRALEFSAAEIDFQNSMPRLKTGQSTGLQPP
jgi:type IV secretion system protein VirB10